MTADIERRRARPDFCPQIFNVRRILILFFAMQLISGNLLGEELCKMPNLIRHYRIHQHDNPGASWSSFLRLHYANTQHRHADPAHRQLPLQSASGNSVQAWFPPGHAPAFLPLQLAVQRRNLPDCAELLLPSDFRAGLFRPPCV